MDSELPVPIQLAIAEADGLKVRRKPGRPRKLVSPPALDEIELARKELRAVQAYVDADEFVQWSAENYSYYNDGNGLWRIVRELAIESANLKFDVYAAQSAGRDGIPKLISRRIEALAKIAAILIDMKKIGLDHLDSRSIQVRRVHELFMAIVAKVARATLADADSFTERLAEELSGWEEMFDRPVGR